jgi:preprotein translocase subunit SecG
MFFVRVFLGLTLALTAFLLICLVMLQRGRGGGLAGALGGMGGQSAFGTKAGDLFTRITVAFAAFWIVLCILATNVLARRQSLLSADLGGAIPTSTMPMTPTTPTTPATPSTPAGAPAAAPEAGGDAAPAPAPAAQPPAAQPPAASAPAAPAPAGQPAAPAEAPKPAAAETK